MLRQRSVYAIVIAVTTAVVYANALSGPYMIDDRVLFKSSKMDLRSAVNHFVSPISDENAGLPGPEEIYYRPLAHVWLAAVHTAVGGKAAGHHAANMVCWILAAVLLFYFLSLLSQRPVWAFLASLFYAIHPINGVVVNYASGGVFAMQVICMIASMWCAWRALFSDGNRMILTVLSCALFLAAMMFHESAVALALYWFAVLMIFRRETWLSAVRGALPLVAVIALYAVFRLVCTDITHTLAGKAGNIFSIAEYLNATARLAGWYAAKLIYPSGIVLIWSTPSVQGPFAAGLLFWIGVIVLGGWGLVCLRSSPPAALGWAWFLIGFLPFALACLFQSEGITVEPHWFVFSSAGFFMTLTFCLMKLKPRIFFASALALVLLWGGTSRWYNFIWSDEKRYCGHWVAHAPQLKGASFFLARAYVDAGEREKAYEFYSRSLSGRPIDALTLANLGVLDLERGRDQEARLNFQKSIAILPTAAALNGLAILEAKRGDAVAARALFEKALHLDPSDASARANLERLSRGLSPKKSP